MGNCSSKKKASETDGTANQSASAQPPAQDVNTDINPGAPKEATTLDSLSSVEQFAFAQNPLAHESETSRNEVTDTEDRTQSSQLGILPPDSSEPPRKSVVLDEPKPDVKHVRTIDPAQPHRRASAPAGAVQSALDGQSEPRSEVGAVKYDEARVAKMVRSFTRKSLSSEDLRSQSTRSFVGRGPRRDSRIEVMDVLVAVSKDPQARKSMPALRNLDVESVASIDEVQAKAPDVAERVQRRRVTMEKIDIFSPDIEAQRFDELYEIAGQVMQAEDEKSSRPSSFVDQNVAKRK